MGKPLILASVCYLAGLVLGEGLDFFPLTLALLALAAGAGAMVLHRRRALPAAVWLAASGLMVLGIVRIQIAGRDGGEDDLLRFATRETVRLTGTVDEAVRRGPAGSVVMISARTVNAGGADHPVRGRLRLTARDFDPPAGYGDRIRVELKLRPPGGFQNPGGFDYGAYLRREGVRATGVVHRPEAIERIGTAGFAPLRRIYDGREKIRRMLEASLPPEGSAVLQAMLIGETAAIGPDLRDAFQISGTAHLLSISGSHLALVAWAVFALTRGALRRLPSGWLLAISRRMTPTRLAVLATLPPVVFYTLLAGAQTAAVRSLMMILVYLASVWLERTDDALNALAGAALLILLWDPFAIFSVSFQLSFVAVLAMVLAARARRFRGREEAGTGDPAGPAARVPGSYIEKVKSALWISAAAGAATLPLTAHHFNQLAWVGFISNVVVIPFTGLIVVPIGLSSAILGWMLDHTVLPFAAVNDAATQFLLILVRAFAQIPGAELHTPSPPVIVILSLYLAAAVLAWQQSGVMRRAGVLALCLAIAAVWTLRLAAGHSDPRLRLIFFDVGQGDAAWIELPDGRTLLVDGGAAIGNFDLGRLVIAPYLWNTARRRIDFLAVSHPQLDHMGGLNYILQQFDVGEIWTNGRRRRTAFDEAFHRTAGERDIPIRVLSSESLTVSGPGGWEIRALHPPAADGPLFQIIRAAGSKENDHSLVLQIRYGRETVLFTGDIERPAERMLLDQAGLQAATVLKVPHHGSRTSIEPAFLRRVRPGLAVMSVGANNPFGHPSDEALEAYREIGTRIYRTDRDGAVWISSDGFERTVNRFRDWRMKPVGWGRTTATEEGGNLLKLFLRYWNGVR